jgi:hypothetical protein
MMSAEQALVSSGPFRTRCFFNQVRYAVNKNSDMIGNKLAAIDALEISPLTDDELDAVTGGWADKTTAASCTCCTAGATHIKTQ